jgi:hypothetical protein
MVKRNELKLNKNKSIPEMTWEEILALPTENISNKKIAEFRRKEALKRKK